MVLGGVLGGTKERRQRAMPPAQVPDLDSYCRGMELKGFERFLRIRVKTPMRDCRCTNLGDS